MEQYDDRPCLILLILSFKLAYKLYGRMNLIRLEAPSHPVCGNTKTRMLDY